MSTPTIVALIVAFSFVAGAVSWWRFKSRIVAVDGGEILREATSPSTAAHLTEIKVEASRLGYVPVWSGVVDPLDYAELHVHPANGSLLQMGVTHVLVEPKVLYGLLQPVERRSTWITTVPFRVVINDRSFAQAFPHASLGDLYDHHSDAVGFLHANGVSVDRSTPQSARDDYVAFRLFLAETLRRSSALSTYLRSLGTQLRIRRICLGPLEGQRGIHERIRQVTAPTDGVGE